MFTSHRFHLTSITWFSFEPLLASIFSMSDLITIRFELVSAPLMYFEDTFIYSNSRYCFVTTHIWRKITSPCISKLCLFSLVSLLSKLGERVSFDESRLRCMCVTILFLAWGFFPTVLHLTELPPLASLTVLHMWIYHFYNYAKMAWTRLDSLFPSCTLVRELDLQGLLIVFHLPHSWLLPLLVSFHSTLPLANRISWCLWPPDLDLQVQVQLSLYILVHWHFILEGLAGTRIC